MTADNRQNLLQSKVIIESLYDEDILLDISASVASGFVSLLGGAPPSESDAANPPPSADVNLSFLAITEGNVLDACFGVENVSARRNKETPASKKSKKAKEMLADAAYANDDFKTIAVQGYRDAFRAVVVYQHETSKLNYFTACLRTKKIRNKAVKNVKVALLAVAEAIAETS